MIHITRVLVMGAEVIVGGLLVVWLGLGIGVVVIGVIVWG